MQQESKPDELENADRYIMRLEMERQALTGDAARNTDTNKRLKEIDRKLAAVRKEAAALQERWNREKNAISERKQVQLKLDEARRQLAAAERMGDFARASQLAYGEIPELEKQLPRDKSAEGESRVSASGERLVSEFVTAADVADVVSRATGIPIGRLVGGERERLLHIDEHLRKTVIGQDEAVATVANAVRIGRAGLNEENRPLASFMFVGPTGAGKTLLSKTLAEFLFGSHKNLIRLDMSEFGEKVSCDGIACDNHSLGLRVAAYGFASHWSTAGLCWLRRSRSVDRSCATLSVLCHSV